MVVKCRLVAERTFGYEGPSPEPGDLFYFVYHELGKCSCWDNCDGKHLMVTLPIKSPGGFYYTHDLTYRVANCSMPDDRIHRCRVVVGEPPNITLKAGCAVGSSIGYPWPDMAFHGFLENGKLRDA